jgi:cytochrome b pre-mRNA-processing protein 3
MMPFRTLFARPRHETAVRGLYEAIVAAARHPHLYEGFGVPDTIDGRYDMIILHTVLVLDRLKSAGEEGSLISQKLSEYLFADMDRSLREMGVGDLSVGKKVRRMAEVFFGRARAYGQGFESGSRDMLAAAIARNVFPDESAPQGAGPLADYALSAREHLRRTAGEAILAGRLEFEEPRA